jgi:hypothetical protein
MMMSDSLAQRLGWVLWPSFLVACVAELLLFSLFDPRDLQLFGQPVELDRTLVYSLGFFALWAIGAGSSALTVFLERSPFELNRRTLTAADSADEFSKPETLAEPAAPPLERS